LRAPIQTLLHRRSVASPPPAPPAPGAEVRGKTIPDELVCQKAADAITRFVSAAKKVPEVPQSYGDNGKRLDNVQHLVGLAGRLSQRSVNLHPSVRAVPANRSQAATPSKLASEAKAPPLLPVLWQC
jgi:hypothetical protein